MEGKEVSLLGGLTLLTNWFPTLLETQVDLLATTLTSVLTTFKPPHQATAPAADAGGGIAAAQSKAQHVGKKVRNGLLGAVYTALVLMVVMAVAVVVGVVLVNYWVDHPVFVREKLHFDYTDVNPHAMVVLGGKGGRKGGAGGGAGGVPVGHTIYVSVLLLVPDSEYNRDIGVFQLMAEVVSTNGRIIATSSQPSMLEYHSYPIRLTRTFINGLPIILGLTRETQKIKVPILQYKETTVSRTEALKVTLMPRAGVPYLPQIYEAEIIMHSKLPRIKELVHNWKWTLYVWTSLYVYIVLLLLLFSFFRTLLILPLRGSDRDKGRVPGTVGRGDIVEVRVRGGREFSETLRKWQHYRRKRKAVFLSRSTFSEDVGSTSASSYTVTKGEIGPAMEEVSDSGSVCKEG